MFWDWVFVDMDVDMVWITCVYILYILGFGDFWGSIETRTCAFLISFNISLTTNNLILYLLGGKKVKIWECGKKPLTFL
jgi:hypothetical protein